MNVTNGFTSMEQIRHRMQTTDSQRQVKKQTVQTNTASFDEIFQTCVKAVRNQTD